MRISKTMLVCLAIAGLSACCAQDLTDTTKADNFAMRAASSDKLEIESSQLALQKSSASEVKNLAQLLFRDHQKSSRELTAALAQSGENQPPGELLPYHQNLLRQLQTSQNFDCDFLNTQWVIHRQAIALFDAYSSYGDNEQLQMFATQTLPNLLQHLHMIEDAENASQCAPHFQPPPAIKKHRDRHTDADQNNPSNKE